MKISNYVSLAEVTRSDTAKRRGIDNNPTPEHLENLKVVCSEVFDKAREYFGVPLFISSGYRSTALNKAVRGSLKSDHSKGKALDLDQDGHGNGVTNRQVFDYIKNNLEFDQLIWEFGSSNNPDWVHVGYRKGENRKQVLRALKGADGKTVYVQHK